MLHSDFIKDNENLKRALEDMRFQNEDHIKAIHMKNEEVLYLKKELDEWKMIMNTNGDEVNQLK
jgi:hypothetical protein